MRTLVIASQKGGAGKTTLACALAVEAARGASVALFDTDPQGGTARWHERRRCDRGDGNGAPQLFEVHAHGLRRSLELLPRRGIDIVVIDTPPQVSQVIARAIEVADLVLIPVQPSVDDVEAVAATVALAEHAGRPVLFCVNRVKPRVAATRETLAALAEVGPIAPMLIFDRVLHAEARVHGRTAGELHPTSKASQEITELWRHLATRLA